MSGSDTAPGRSYLYRSYLYRRPCSIVTAFRIFFMSASVRLNDVRLTSGFIRCLAIDLGRANSRNPSAP